MPRTLSAGVQAALAASVQRSCHLLEFTAGASTYRFTDGDGSGGGITHGGNLYLPHLRVVSGPRYSEELKRQSCVVRLQNITLTSAALVKDQQELLQGPEATLSRLFLAALEAVTIFAGRIGEVRMSEEAIELTLESDIDPLASKVPRRKYAAVSTIDGLTFEEHVTAGDENLFDGFTHLTRELTQEIHGQQPGYEEGE